MPTYRIKATIRSPGPTLPLRLPHTYGRVEEGIHAQNRSEAEAEMRRRFDVVSILWIDEVPELFAKEYAMSRERIRPSVKPIAEWIEELSHRPATPLSKWEEDFLESIDDQYRRTMSLSDAQTDILERIYKERVLGERSRRYDDR